MPSSSDSAESRVHSEAHKGILSSADQRRRRPPSHACYPPRPTHIESGSSGDALAMDDEVASPASLRGVSKKGSSASGESCCGSLSWSWCRGWPGSSRRSRPLPRRLGQLLFLLLFVVLFGVWMGYCTYGPASLQSQHDTHQTTTTTITAAVVAREKDVDTQPSVLVSTAPNTSIAAPRDTKDNHPEATWPPEENDVPPTPPTNTTSEPLTPNSIAPSTTTTATMPSPSAQPQTAQPTVFHVPQPLPASWADGGGSVRIARAFTVLTVAAGPPLSLNIAAGAAAAPSTPDLAFTLLRRAALGLCRSGLALHDNFYEWLIMHDGAPTSMKASTAAREEEAAVVRAWWAAELTAEVQPRVRVAGLPPGATATAHATTRAFALLYGARLVVTEYVLLHDLHRVLISVPSTWQVKAEKDKVTERGTKCVQQEVSLALQALSNNAFENVSTVLVDQARATLAEEKVHAYRLQVYSSADRQDVVHEAELQRHLVDSVKKILQASAEAANTTAINDDNNKEENKDNQVEAPEDGPLVSKKPPLEAENKVAAATAPAVHNGLPVADYGTALHFHCQRAPLYNVRVPVPWWLRASQHKRPATTATATTNDTGDELPTHVDPPVLSTLCEVMLSRHSGMPEAFTGDATFFHHTFCQEWLQFALLPSPVTPTNQKEGEQPVANLPRGPGAPVVGVAEHDETYLQRMDMTQSLGGGLCTVEWLTHLKAAQLWYKEEAERRQQAKGKQHSTTSYPPTANNNISSDRVYANMAGPSPYLSQYAALLFSDDAAQLSRLAGTYLAFLPNASYALHRLRETMEHKLALVSLKYAADRTRRFKSKKEMADREVVCLPSHLARVDTESTLYDTQWLLTQLVLRCLKRKEKCLGGYGETAARATHNMHRYLSTTGKWSRGEFRVCMSAGVYVADTAQKLT